MELSFAEQIKIILKRKNMTIQDLAFLYEEKTGIKMTRQNLSQRLRRDNFPEQDMKELAALLGYHVSVSLTPVSASESLPIIRNTPSLPVSDTGDVSDKPSFIPVLPKTPAVKKIKTADGSTFQVPDLLHKSTVCGEINPLTGEEYLTNTVRRHPEMVNYLQVYDRSTHEWSDVNEDYFWEFQASKKEILGSDYQEPIVI